MKKRTKKVAVVFAVTAFIAIAGIVVFMLWNAEQDIDTILNSEILKPYGFEIVRPDIQYYSFAAGARGIVRNVEVTLHVQGIYGSYYFTPGGWTDRRIAELVLVSEDGIRFAKDFLGVELSRPLSFVFNVTEPDENHPIPIWGGGGAIDTSIFISMRARRLPALIVHEAVHAILQYVEWQSNFPTPPETSWRGGVNWLEEGLCDFIEFLFASETEHSYRTNYGNRHLHTNARGILRRGNYQNASEFGSRYPQLMDTQTAASFIYFLLEYHGSIEDFMQVFADIYLMENVFGTSMEDMIVKWMAYIDEFR